MPRSVLPTPLDGEVGLGGEEEKRSWSRKVDRKIENGREKRISPKTRWSMVNIRLGYLGGRDRQVLRLLMEVLTGHNRLGRHLTLMGI